MTPRIDEVAQRHLADVVGLARILMGATSRATSETEYADALVDIVPGLWTDVVLMAWSPDIDGNDVGAWCRMTLECRARVDRISDMARDALIEADSDIDSNSFRTILRTSLLLAMNHRLSDDVPRRVLPHVLMAQDAWDMRRN